MVLLIDPTRPSAQQIFVDNTDPEFSSGGSWFASANPGFFGTDSLVNSVGEGLDTATWTPNLPAAGRYEVAAWWVAASNRAPDAPYIVQHLGGTTTVRVNQTANGSQWNVLGNFDFAAGSAGYITLRDDASGSFVSADAIRLTFLGSTSCVLTGDPLEELLSASSCNECEGFLLPGSLESHPETAYYLQSDLPERFLTEGVLYATTDVLPPFDELDGTPVSASMRTQSKNGFTTIDDDFDLFLFHITSPGDGSTPRRVVVYARNDGTSTITLDPKQIVVTDGIIGTVHEMESTLGRRVLEEDWETPVSPVSLAPGTGEVVAYSKRFGASSNGTDQSANVNAFGRVRVAVDNPISATDPTDLELFVVAIPGVADTGQNKSLAEGLLAQGAQSGETAIDLNSTPSGCALRRAVGVYDTFVWRSEVLDIDVSSIGLGGDLPFQMALPDIQSAGCTDARQTPPLRLHPPYTRPDNIGNFMAEYRVTLHLVNRDASTLYNFDLTFGKDTADIGLAWQIATGTTPPGDATVDAQPVRSGWAGPNQSGDLADNTRSFLESDGGPIVLAPCDDIYVTIRFLILGNSSLPFQLHVQTDGPVPVRLSGLRLD